MSHGKLLLVLAGILFILASLTVFGFVRLSAEGLALLGFAAWALSGAV